VQVPLAVAGNVSNKGALQLSLNAALMCALSPVNAFTKIVVLDSRGRTSKALARAVTSLGYCGYEAQGGFAAWRSAGLATKVGGTYQVTAGAHCFAVCRVDIAPCIVRLAHFQGI
jgi:hypothetical protein